MNKEIVLWSALTLYDQLNTKSKYNFINFNKSLFFQTQQIPPHSKPCLYHIEQLLASHKQCEFILVSTIIVHPVSRITLQQFNDEYTAADDTDNDADNDDDYHTDNNSDDDDDHDHNTHYFMHLLTNALLQANIYVSQNVLKFFYQILTIHKKSPQNHQHLI